MKRFNLVLQKKRIKTVEDDPRKKKVNGAPRKKLRGFALVKFLKENAKANPHSTPMPTLTAAAAVSKNGNETTSSATCCYNDAGTCIPTKRTKFQHPVTDRRTRSNRLRWSARATTSVSILDPSHIPDPAHLTQGSTTCFADLRALVELEGGGVVETFTLLGNKTWAKDKYYNFC